MQRVARLYVTLETPRLWVGGVQVGVRCRHLVESIQIPCRLPVRPQILMVGGVVSGCQTG